MLKIKRFLHWLYVLMPAFLTFVVYNRISAELEVLEKWPVPRWIFLVFAISYILIIIWIGLVRFSVASDFDDAEDKDGLQRYSIAESLHYTTTETLVTLFGMAYFRIVQMCIPSWQLVASFYGWVVLLLFGMPFIISFFSIFSVIKPKSGAHAIESEETYKKIIKFLWISSIIAMMASVANIVLSLWISSMDVCILSYFVLIPAFVFEWIYLRKSLKKIWPDNDMEIDEKEKEEGIL